MITIHTLRNLDPMFDRFVEFAEDKAMTETQAPNFDQLCKNLENEKLRITSEDIGTANYMKKKLLEDSLSPTLARTLCI